MTVLDIAQFLQLKIVYLFAYFPVVTLIGFLQAWLTTKMGDDTAKDWGFLTLDPAVHFDPFGFFILAFPWQLLGSDVNIGFGKFIPTSVEGIYGKYKKLKKFIILFSSSVAAFLAWMFFSLFILVVFTTASFVQKLWTGNNILVDSKYVLIAFIKLIQGLLSLSSELFFVFLIINIVDAALYKFDKEGSIKNNIFLRFLIIIIAAMLLTPVIRLLFILFVKFLFKM